MTTTINLKRSRWPYIKWGDNGERQDLRNRKGLRGGGEKGCVLKEGDISGDKVSMSRRGITTITLLKSRISQEDAFCGFGGKLVLSRSENMNKTSTPKDTRRKEIKWLVREEKGMRNLIV